MKKILAPKKSIFFYFSLIYYQKYKSNATVKPANIVVKTERQVESVLGIKRENDSHNSDITTNGSSFISQPNANSWVQEKKSLIGKIVALQSENQRMLFELKQSQSESEKMAIENRSLMEKVNQNDKIHSNELVQLQSQLAQLNAMLKKMNDDNLKRIAELTHGRDLFKAQLKQLQNSLAQQAVTEQQNEPNKSDDDFYEVECLLDDKLVQTHRFLVRWKGYDSSHDSWIDEENLNCRGILRKYKLSKKK